MTGKPTPYAAPRSAPRPMESSAVATEMSFYVVSPAKFMVLYYVTVGIYPLYWYYRNWNQWRITSGERVLPAIRAVFPIFFVAGLLDRVHGRMKAQGIRSEWNPRMHATGIVILMVLTTVLQQLASHGVGHPWLHLVWLATLVPMADVLCNAQRQINIACGDPDGTSNAIFTLANIAWAVIGLAFWLFTVYGTYLMFTAPGP